MLRHLKYCFKFPYMWVILCLRRKHHTNVPLVGERLASPARARKRSDVTRGHMWAILSRLRMIISFISALGGP